MKKPALAFPANRRTHHSSCTDQVVGDILSGWRYDISGLSPAMRTDYEQHLSECSHCRRRQQIARTIPVVIRRVELVTHIFTMHVRLTPTHYMAISLEAVAVTGLIFSTLLWVLVAVATPLPGFLGGIVQEHIPADLRERFSKDAA